VNRTVPLILAVALFMENMDSTVIATSLPAIATDIGTSPVALKLALTAYLVSLAIFIPVSSWMADRYGAKRVFRTAIGIFVLGSVACAFSGSLAAFVLARFLQGVGGAMMTPVARLVLVRSTPKRELISALAWLTIPALIGPMVGPPVGGFITTFFSWHWIFIINVPIGIAGILLSSVFLPEVPPAGTGRIDTPGFVLSGLAAAGIVFGLSVVSLPALPPIVGVLAMLLGAAAAALYVRHARRSPRPLLDLRLFGNPVFRTAIIGGALFRIGNGAVPFLLPLLLQLGFGMTPFQSGMLTFATAIGAFAMKFLAPYTLRLGGFRTTLATTAVLSSLLIAANGLFTAQTPGFAIIAVLVTAGFFRSLLFTSVNALVFADIEDKDASQATAIGAVAQQISIALGVAIGGGVLEAFAAWSGGALDPSAFTAAFVVIAAITGSSLFAFLTLSPTAGNAVSGHRLKDLQAVPQAGAGREAAVSRDP
jgi:EmrB/QacA subfamily drug resistance transporter